MTSKSRMFLLGYFAGSSIYGGLRKIPLLWNAKNNDESPILLGTKTGIVTLSAFYAPILAPLWLCVDLDRLDAYARGIPCKHNDVICSDICHRVIM